MTPLRECDMPTDVTVEWQSPLPSADVLRGWLLEQMHTQTGIDPDPSRWMGSDLDRARRWLGSQRVEGPFFIRKRSILQQLLFANLSDKVQALAQRECAVCAGLAPEGQQFSVETFPVRITPRSRQSLAEAVDWAALQATVRDWFDGRGATIRRGAGPPPRDHIRAREGEA